MLFFLSMITSLVNVSVRKLLRILATQALLVLILFSATAFNMPVYAEEIKLPAISIQFNDADGNQDLNNSIKVLFLLTVLSLAPAILVVMTSFTRIIVVLSMLRHALGMQQTPPNTVIISLALFLTFFNMMPVFSTIDERALKPYAQGELSTNEALEQGLQPMREFMIRQTRESDLALLLEIAGKPQPNTIDDIDTLVMMPAFMLSELKSAFQIGFVIYLPFLLIDIIVASILMSMGMLMVPPMMISLPIKILMFVLIDGWNIVVKALLQSFA